MMQSEIVIDDLEQIEDEASHVLHFWSPFKTKVTKDYNFLPNNFLFTVFSTFLTWFACIVLSVFNKIVFGFKIIGKDNLKSVKGGKITVSNHVHPMDCTMVRNF